MSGDTAAADRPVIAALDTADVEQVRHWSAQLGGVVGRLKIGLEAFVAVGPDVLRAARDPHAADAAPGIFLDLKLHDIPNTVAGAAGAVASLGVDMLTVHAAGGPAMIAAAVDAAPDVDILAVTVLTSLDDDTLTAVGQPSVAEQVLRLGEVALDAGAAGLVCAGSEVARLRAAFGPDPLLVVPGIRRAGRDGADQARVATARATMAAGANWLVVGRPITTAEDPLMAAARFVEDAVAGRSRPDDEEQR